MRERLTQKFARFLIPGGTFIDETESIDVSGKPIDKIEIPEGACAVRFADNPYFDTDADKEAPIIYLNAEIISIADSANYKRDNLSKHMILKEFDAVAKVGTLKEFFRPMRAQDIVIDPDNGFKQTWPEPREM